MIEQMRRVRLVLEALALGLEVKIPSGYVLANHPDAAEPFICFRFECYVGEERMPDKYVGGDDMGLNWFIKEVGAMSYDDISSIAVDVVFNKLK
jgi:hypothetical protein